MQPISTDICVIGAGAGGLSVAAGAVQMGAGVVLIEGGKMGGDCLNYGCVPSKALIAAGKRAAAMRDGTGFGVGAVEPQIDFAAANDHVRRVIASIAPVDSQDRFEGLGVTVIRDWARFVSKTELEAGGRRVTARRFVIATGSRPFVPPVPGLDGVPYFTNETIFELREAPGHLVIIGGGPIGMELAQAHARLGAKVTVIEGDRALGREDPKMAAVVLTALRAEGVGIVENAPAGEVRQDGTEIIVRTADGRSFSGSHLLVAVGRTVDLDRLNLDAAGIDHDRKGVTVNASLRSVSNRRVFAVGDAAGGAQFTHLAGYHAGIVIRQALFGLPAKARDDHIPRVTYTDPELAQVGLTEAEARARHGDRLTVVRSQFAENDRAVTDATTDGQIKVMVAGGRPVGASIVGPQAGDLIGIWALALSARLKMSEIAGMVAPYPTLTEVSKRAAGAYFSPKLFDNPRVRQIVGLIQRFLP